MKKIFYHFLIIQLIVLLMLPAILWAAKSPVTIADFNNDEEAPAVAYNWLLDEFLIVWHMDLLGNGDYDIWGRIEGADGLAKTPIFKITRDSSAQKYPDVDYNRIDDEYFVVWQDEREGNFDIIAARIAADGSKIDPDITYKNETDSTIVVSNNTHDQDRPKVAHNYTDNCYLVVWQDYRDITESPVYNLDVYSQRVYKNGEILPPSIYLDPAINYPIASEEVPADGYNYEYARESHPDVAYHGSYGTELNEWLVVFERYTVETGSRIWGMRINGPSGYHLNSYGEEFSKIYEEPLDKQFMMPVFWLPWWCSGFPIGTPEVPADPEQPFKERAGQKSPHVISNSVWFPDGPLMKNDAPIMTGYPVPEFLVAWTDFRSSVMSENANIYCQRVAYFPDSTAVKMGLKEEPGPDSLFVAVLLDSLGNPPVMANNWIEWTNYPITNHPNFQSWNDLAFNQNTGEYLVVWNDYRDSEWDGGTSISPTPHADIYGQRLYINPDDSALIWIDADDNWYADPAVNMPIVNTENDEGDRQYPGIDCGVMQSEFLIAYEFDAGPTDTNVDIQGTFYPDEYIPVSVEKNQTVTRDFIVADNYPNPFNPSTTIRIQLPQAAETSVRIYNVLGNEVATLLNENVGKDEIEIHWNGLNHQNQPVASGIYFYRIESGDYTFIQKMMLMR